MDNLHREWRGSKPGFLMKCVQHYREVDLTPEALAYIREIAYDEDSWADMEYSIYQSLRLLKLNKRP